jgi:hypothetical protein
MSISRDLRAISRGAAKALRGAALVRDGLLLLISP